MLLVAGCSKAGRRSRRHRGAQAGVAGAVGARASRPIRRSTIPPGAECGKLSVPVDYDKPDGDVAQLAMIRFKATGDKIGSLVINPGGPGESGVESAVNLVATLPASVRERFDLVGFDPRGVASSTPAVWCNSDADNDRLRADPQVDYSPAGRRPHRERDQGSSCSAVSTSRARSFWPTSARPMSSRISTRSGPRSATTS